MQRFTVFENRYALLHQRSPDHISRISVFISEDFSAFNNGNLAAKPAMRLRHLYPNRATTDDDQMLRLFPEIKDRFIRMRLYSVDAVNWRDKW